MALNLVNTVGEFLRQRPEQKFTAREIADWIYATYPDECHAKLQRSKDRHKGTRPDGEVIIGQIVAEFGSVRLKLQKDHPGIKTIEGRPRKYYFTESSDSAEVDSAENQGAMPSTVDNPTVIKEQDLYPMLSEFLLSELGVYSKRIDEKRSRNARGAGGNKWLYPDLVGLEDLSGDWHQEIKNCVQQYSDKKTKLWSFEVKILINRSNLREAFFQAVSNSSWANFGYLVASEIEGTDTSKELRMLASLHGIGFIQLDAENPTEGQIIIPAQERSQVDWDTANRLTEENKDFREYIKLIRQFYQTGDIRPADWDSQVD